ncbi:retrovirus-related pol polyprotein from transposon TNT 1-94 [Tanacetum coccineum]
MGCHDIDSDVEEDTKSSNEFLADMNVKFHDRALLANQKRFYKRSGRVGSAKKPMDKSNETCFACGILGHFQKECPTTKTSTPSYPSSNKSYNKPKFHTNLPPQQNQNVDNHQKYYKGKYKGLKAEIAIVTKKIDVMSKGKSEKGLVAESFDWDEESVSSEDNGVTKVKEFMAIAEDELSVGKGDAKSDYTHVDLHYVEDQRKNLLNKFNYLNLELSSLLGNIVHCDIRDLIRTVIPLEMAKSSFYVYDHLIVSAFVFGDEYSICSRIVIMERNGVLHAMLRR